MKRNLLGAAKKITWVNANRHVTRQKKKRRETKRESRKAARDFSPTAKLETQSTFSSVGD